MNFVDFLLEYYVWILVVLVIGIITIIGFLADVRSKKKKKAQMVEDAPVKEPATTPIESIVTPENNPKMDINNVNAVTEQTVTPIVEVQPQVTVTNVENQDQQKVEEPIYRSLSDQKPKFESVDVQMPKEVVVTPTPITPTPMTTPVVEPIVEQMIQPQVMEVQPQVAPIITEQPQVVVPSVVETPQAPNIAGSAFVVGEQTITSGVPVAPIEAPVIEPQVAPVAPVETPVIQPQVAPIAPVEIPVIQPQVAPIAPVETPVIQPQVAPIAPIEAPVIQPQVAPVAPVETPVIEPQVAPMPQQTVTQSSINDSPTITIPVTNPMPAEPITTTAEKIENDDLWKL